jgi:hypothetical protein
MTDTTRKDLYKRVWAQPMSTLAKEFGLSDRGLAKICGKYDIPRPVPSNYSSAYSQAAIREHS